MAMKGESTAERAERLCQAYFGSEGFDDDGPRGACRGCEFLIRGGEHRMDEPDLCWCLLAHGIYQSQNCHKCPGIKDKLALNPPPSHPASALERLLNLLGH
jgi:hypothetical protein